LPNGESRPELVAGAMPRDLKLTGNQFLRVHLWVDTGGAPYDITILSSNAPEWDEPTLKAIRGWRFSPAKVNGTAVGVEGLFEVSGSVSGAVSPAPH
jgi:TonB family protein